MAFGTTVFLKAKVNVNFRTALYTRETGKTVNNTAKAPNNSPILLPTLAPGHKARCTVTVSKR